MKKAGLMIVAFILISCHSNVKKEDIVKLNGYWEIQKVALPNGGEKEYKVNETIDFFELRHPEASGQPDKEILGFRQKVMPQFDGKFRTNGIKENVKIAESNGTFFIEYHTPYGKWKEEIMEIKDSSLVLKNKQNLEYTYKRFRPFSIK